MLSRRHVQGATDSARVEVFAIGAIAEPIAHSQLAKHRQSPWNPEESIA
jgi:hypothetical protein